MSELEQQLERIFKGIKTLSGKYEKAIAAIAKLEGEKAKLEQDVRALEKEKKLLTEKLLAAEIAGKTAGSDEDKKQMKVKINELVREIDKCISLLNQ